MTRTLGPWTTGKSCDGFLTVTDGTKTICTVGEADLFPDIIEADAAFIVRACNGHEAMLEALRAARAKLELWPEGSNPEYFPEIKAIDQALRLAEGGKP